jgi:hypothetical protein
MRGLALLLLWLAFLSPTTAHAVPPVDPPLTYVITAYDRDGRFAPDGTRVSVIELPRVRERRGLPVAAPGALCGEAFVSNGRALLRVEISTDCPVGMYASLGIELPHLAITAYSDPPFEWRRAYSEATATMNVAVHPIPPRS